MVSPARFSTGEKVADFKLNPISLSPWVPITGRFR